MKVVWVGLLVGCAGEAEVIDRDGDGFDVEVDCNDDDVTVFPGAADVCDGIDNNCNGEIDEGVVRTFFADDDGDGFGDPLTEVTGCEVGEGVVDNALDCDDADEAVRPGVDEVCDEVDNDCDGAIDEGVTMIVYVDADGDGHGDPSLPTPACAVTTGFAAAGSDCDDGNEAIRPGADEVCDDVDNDCDLLVDEDPVDAPPRFADLDDDGYGDTPVVSCDPLPFTSVLGGDCNDADANVNPGLLFDPCDNLVDDDCDGLVDNDCPIEHCGFVGTDETWVAGPVHHVTCSVVVTGNPPPQLTIDDGALVVFDADTILRSGNPGFGGRIVMDGHTSGIVLTSAAPQPAPGDWRGILYSSSDQNSTMTGTTVQYAGGGEDVISSVSMFQTDVRIVDSAILDGATTGILVGTSATAEVSGTLLAGHAADGLSVAGGSLARGGGATFANNVVTGNGVPLTVRSTDLAELSATSTYVGNGDDRVWVISAGLPTDAVWEGIDVPLFFPDGVNIGSGQVPELVLSDGLVLQFGWNSGFLLGSSFASLVVDGHTQGVTMESEQGAAGQPGDWNGLTFGINAEDSRIDGLLLRHGGAGGSGISLSGVDVTMTNSHIVENAGNGIWMNGSSTLGIRDTEIRGNLGDGVRLEGELSTLSSPSFTGNDLRDNGGVPLALVGNSLVEVDTTNTFAGNGISAIEVMADGVTRSGTWFDHGIPLWFTGSVGIAAPTSPVITIEAGNELWFEPEVFIELGRTSVGGLVVGDSASEPVIFTSASVPQAPGDWRGLLFYGNCIDAESRLENVEVRFGGSDGQGAVQFRGCDGTVVDSTVADSSSFGIYRTNGANPTLTNVTYDNNAAGDVF